MSELEQVKGRGQDTELCDNFEKLREENLQLSREIHELRTQLATEIEEVKKGERRKMMELEREVERLTNACGVGKDETSALRYQLSSASMELQQMKEVCTHYYLGHCPNNVPIMSQIRVSHFLSYSNYQIRKACCHLFIKRRLNKRGC